METEVDVDGGAGSFEVEGVHAQHVLQLEQLYVGAQGHLAHAVRVEVKLVVCDLHKVLHQEESRRQKLTES